MFIKILILGLSILMLVLTLYRMLTVRKPEAISNELSNNNFLQTKTKR